MVKVGTGEKVYPLVKIALVVDALKEAGVPPVEVLRGAHVSADELYSPAVHVCLNQVLEHRSFNRTHIRQLADNSNILRG